MGSASQDTIENVKSQSLDQLEMMKQRGHNKAGQGLLSAGLIKKTVEA